MTRKIVTMLLCAALLMSLFVPAVADETIKIGGLAPLTGDVATYGIAIKQGMDLYVKQLNQAGGIEINGEKKLVEILWEDERGLVGDATAAYTKLVYSENVAAILGDVTTTPTLAVAQMAAEDGIPMITASATAYEVTTDKPNVFRTCFLDPFQGSVMASFAKEVLSAQKVAVLYDNGDAYSTGLAESFSASAKDNGQSVVAYESASAADVDFKSQLTKIKAAQPDAVFLAYYYGPAALILTQADEIGLSSVKFLGADGIGGVEDLINDKSLLTKMYYSDHFTSKVIGGKGEQFVAEYTAEYGAAPVVSFSATGYDAALVLCQAIQSAGSTDYAKVVEALKATNVEAVTGNITFDAHNDPIKSAFILTYDETGDKVFVKQLP